MLPFKKLWCTTWLIWLIWSRCAPIETFILVTTLGHQVLDPGRQWQPTFGQLTTFKTLATFPFPSRPPDLGPFYPGYWHPKCIFSSADGVGVSAHLGPPRQGLWQPRHMNRRFSFYLKKKNIWHVTWLRSCVLCSSFKSISSMVLVCYRPWSLRLSSWNTHFICYMLQCVFVWLCNSQKMYLKCCANVPLRGALRGNWSLTRPGNQGGKWASESLKPFLAAVDVKSRTKDQFIAELQYQNPIVAQPCNIIVECAFDWQQQFPICRAG